MDQHTVAAMGGLLDGGVIRHDTGRITGQIVNLGEKYELHLAMRKPGGLVYDVDPQVCGINEVDYRCAPFRRPANFRPGDAAEVVLVKLDKKRLDTLRVLAASGRPTTLDLPKDVVLASVSVICR